MIKFSEFLGQAKFQFSNIDLKAQNETFSFRKYLGSFDFFKNQKNISETYDELCIKRKNFLEKIHQLLFLRIFFNEGFESILSHKI